MASIYLINNTQGSLITTIAPTGENTTSTDLRLYGMGHLLWGEGVDENFYRLLEHFACPEKPLMPDFPQDEIDLASPGSGINDPVNGQIWYNTTKQRPYWYEAVSNTWIAIASFFSGPLPPPSPTVGTLWYDPNAQPCPPGGTSQLKVWNGVAFVSVALNYVAKCGDTMTGFLTLNADPINPLHAATKQYVDNEIAAQAAQDQLDFVNVTGDTMTGALTMSGAQINMGTNKIINVGNPTIAGDALNLGFADGRYVNVTGDIMTGDLAITNPSGNAFFTLSTPVSVFLAGGYGISMQAGNTGVALLDLHSSGAFNDFDSRILATAGTTLDGQGTLTLQAGHINLNTTTLPGGTINLTSGGNTVIDAAGGSLFLDSGNLLIFVQNCRISSLAAGAGATDAINVSQVQGKNYVVTAGVSGGGSFSGTVPNNGSETFAEVQVFVGPVPSGAQFCLVRVHIDSNLRTIDTDPGPGNNSSTNTFTGNVEFQTRPQFGVGGFAQSYFSEGANKDFTHTSGQEKVWDFTYIQQFVGTSFGARLHFIHQAGDTAETSDFNWQAHILAVYAPIIP